MCVLCREPAMQVRSEVKSWLFDDQEANHIILGFKPEIKYLYKGFPKKMYYVLCREHVMQVGTRS